ncbi:Exosome complex exonuclease RRP44, putative [Pediculus humanus corporis]|uniref:Exosome complex exonuclease RRP44, putative n=1 Tax=Pediculus humanus subsp. corporis TaxID=121224 RepID=E0VBF4_PEDHC|nr:Exosome complex exonuclease RRP44, putative [Pediculus humanus corporis]EEB10710.1 Exosome complex exonuclease RRP44, putative [Pediculus humanus corporis]
MLTNHIILKKTKRGSILKVVREHYLRDDLWCGSTLCGKCKQKPKDKVLEKSTESLSSLIKESHYVVLDSSVIIDQIDVLQENVICNAIILQTVINDLQNKNTVFYMKLKDIIANPSRHFCVFVNENHKETYIAREQGEKINERNQRAIRVATKWYSNHLNNAVKIVLITDDVENKEKAIAEGIPAFSSEEYVLSLNTSIPLADKLCQKDCEKENAGEPLYPCHYTPNEIHQGIKNKSLLYGQFFAQRDNFLEGTVRVEGQELSVLVQGRKALNRAVDGDTVAVKLLPESQWVGSSDLVLKDEDEEEDVEMINVDEDIIKDAGNEKGDKKPTGIIVGIIKRKWRQYCGILNKSLLENATRHIFVPAERKIPKVRIITKQSEFLMSQKIVVVIDSWPRPIGDKETENEVLLLEHDVPHSKFSEAVLSFLPELPWIITEDDLKNRVDLRHLDICSVDPPGCTDIDDALHCRKLDNGNFEVGIHIADVTHFIKPGTALDKEAALRGTTVYLVDKRIDMVPELLSSNLCSLRENEDRFAFSCIVEMTKKGKILNTKFHKSVIRSRKAMTYEEAQLKIDDKKQNDNVTQSLRWLNNLAKIIKKKRLDNGALVLASPEVKFLMDSETHDPLDVEAKKIRDTNSMIEEFMLLANISVAEKIFKDFPECAVLRRHPKPPLSNFEPLIKAGRVQNFDISVDTGKSLSVSLEKAVKPNNPYFNTMLKILATRCMMQAVYFSSGMFKEEDFFHYGLACPIYTHFTSPIRRYADIIVHRLLAVSVNADSTYPELLDKRKTQELCNNLNYRNQMAQYAARASVALHTHLFFRDKVQDEEGYILRVRKNALQILIPKYGLEGTLYVSGKKELDVIGFVYNDETQTQRCGDVIFKAFDPVTVQLSLDRSNVQREKLFFRLVNPKVRKLLRLLFFFPKNICRVLLNKVQTTLYVRLLENVVGRGKGGRGRGRKR